MTNDKPLNKQGWFLMIALAALVAAVIFGAMLLGGCSLVEGAGVTKTQYEVDIDGDGKPDQLISKESLDAEVAKVRAELATSLNRVPTWEEVFKAIDVNGDGMPDNVFKSTTVGDSAYAAAAWLPSPWDEMLKLLLGAGALGAVQVTRRKITSWKNMPPPST